MKNTFDFQPHVPAEIRAAVTRGLREWERFSREIGAEWMPPSVLMGNPARAFYNVQNLPPFLRGGASARTWVQDWNVVMEPRRGDVGHARFLATFVNRKRFQCSLREPSRWERVVEYLGVREEVQKTGE